MSLDLKYTFDDKTYRHYINEIPTVLHCHHYITLTIKLAEQLSDLGGPRILVESAEDSIRPFFDNYFSNKNIKSVSERLEICEEFFGVFGLGVMKIDKDTANQTGGRVKLLKSHVDQGWKMKFGSADHHLNYLAQGFIAAAFGATFNTPPRTYNSKEIASIVTGDEVSEFIVSHGGAR